MSRKFAFSIRLFTGKTLAATTLMMASLAAFGQVTKAPSLPVEKVSVPVEAAKMSATFSRLPLAFERNSGQSDPRVKFLSRGPGYGLFLTKNEAVLSLATDKNSKNSDIVRLKIAGARSDAPVTGIDALPGKTNYFIGKDHSKWRTNVANYSKVRYTGVYAGIDLLYYGNQQQLEHDFIVAPGADPKKIALQISGAKKLEINPAGDLVLGTNNGEIRFKKPVIYQEKNGSRVEIAGGYQLEKHNRVSFQVGEYDRTRELIIDPVLNYSTYLTAPATVLANAIAVDSSGNAYITGSLSAGTSFPPTAATACATCGAGGTGDIFVAKLNATGTALTFLSIIGGTASDTGNAIAIDTANPPAVFVTGQTNSVDFPTSTNAFNTTAGNNAPDAFAFKLQNDGAALLYSTYLNGGAAATDHADIGTGIAVGPNGNIYVAGSTASTTFLPAAFAAGIQTANADNTGATTDAFLVKLNPAGTGASDLLYGTYWGGSADDAANAIALFSTDKVYIAGFTKSTANYPTSVGAVQTTFAGSQDGFVASVNTNNAVVSSATCIHATTANTVEFVTAAPHGLVSGDSFIISGVANSTGGTTIVFNGTHTATAGTATNKIHYTTGNCKASTNNDTGVTNATSLVIGNLKYSTLVGGNLVDEVKAVALDGSGNIYATGSTTSTANFPSATSALQNTGLGGGTDAFIVKLNPTGTAISYSGYLGGAGNEVGTSIAVNKACTASCEAYIAGTTTSAGNFFNTNALQGTFGGAQDGFIARISGTTNATLAKVYSTYFGGAGTDTIAGIAATYSGTSAATNTMYLAGNTATAIGSASSFGSAASVTSSAFQTAADAGSTGSGFVAQLSASNAAMPSLGISGNKNLDPIGQSAASTSAVIYTWTVTNTNAAKSVTADVPLPQTGGADLLTISGSPVLAGTGAAGACTKKVGTATAPGGLTCNLGDLTAGGSTTITVNAAPTAAAHCDNAPCSAISQTGKVASAETNSLVTSAVLNSNVAPVTDLVVTGTAVSTPGASGAGVYVQGVDTSLDYNITVTNNSGLTIAANSAGLDVLIESDYPTNFAVTGVALNGTPILPAAFAPLSQGAEGCFDDSANHKIQCNVLSIAAGGTATMVVTGAFSAAPSNAALGNLITTSKFPPADTSEIFTANGSNTNVPVTVDYRGPLADLDVTVNGGLLDSPDPVRGSQTLTYTVNYQNLGPADATNVTITQSFAPSVVQTAKFTATTKPAFCTQATPGANVICSIPDANVTAAAGPQSFTISGSAPLDATVPTDPAFGSTVTISTTGNTSEPVGGNANNTSSSTTVIRREGKLSVDTLTAPLTSSNGPATFQFTFNAANAGLDNATNTHVIFSLPQNVNAISISPGTCTGANTTTPNCNIGTVNAGSGVSVIVTVTPAALGAGVQSSNFSTSITDINSAEVVDLTPGVNKTDGPRVTAIQRQTSLTIAMVQTSPAASGPISTDGTVAAGQVTYRATINNSGTDAGTNVKIGFMLPTNFILKTAPANAGGTCAINPAPAPPAGVSRLECTIASVPAGSTLIDLVIAAPAALVPSTSNSATMDAIAELDLSKSTEIVDNHGTVTLTSATVTTTVERRADLHMISASATAAVSSDGDITHSIQVISNGATATNVSVLLTFDHNYRFQSSNSASGLGAPVCNVTFTSTTRTCTLPDLPTGTPYTFNVIVKPEANIVQTNAPATNKTNVNLLSATMSASVVQNPNTQPDTTGGAAVTEVRRQANLVASNGLTPVSQTVNSGGPVSYTLQVSNQGPDADVGATVIFTFSANAQNFTAFDGSLSGAIGTGLGTCTPNAAAGTVNCVVADIANPIANGATRTGTIKFTPPALAAGVTSASFTGSASIQSAQAYDDGTSGAAQSPGNNVSNSATTTVQTQSDLQVQSVVASTPTTATPVAGNVPDGAPLQYTVTFTNVGDPAGTAANPVVLSHVLPDDFISGVHYGFTLSGVPTWSSSLGSPGSCTLTGAFAPAAAVTCRSTSGAIANGEIITIVESGTATIAPTQTSFAFTDTAKIPTASPGYNDPTSGNNQASATTFQVVRTADLGILQSGGIVVTPILANNTLDTPGATYQVTKHKAVQYDITVQNLSLSSAVSNVLVDAVLPATPITTALTFTSGTNCSVIAAGPPQTVRCTIPAPLGPVGSGTDMATVSFILTPNNTLPSNTPSVQLSFNPSVSASGNTDTNPANNGNIPAAITINRDSDLGVTITGPATPVTVTSPTPGVTPTFTYTITAQNFGPSVATAVRVQDLLPTADLTFVSGTWPTVGSTTAGTCVVGTGNAINCDMASMDVGAVVPITLTVRPILAVSVANKLAISNPVTVSSNNVNDSNTNVNTDSWPVDLRGRADLSVQITPTPVPLPGAHTNISANGTASHALVGDHVSYDVKITNLGPYPAGSQITLTDAPDARVALLSAADISGTGFNCVGAVCTASALPVNGVADIVFVTDVPPSVVPPGQKTTLTNSAVVTQYTNGTTLANDITDPNTVNNTAATPTIVADAAEDLLVSQTAPSSVLTAALTTPNTAVFTVTAANNQDVAGGRSQATNVRITNVVTISPNGSVPSITVPAGCSTTAVTFLNASSDRATVTCNLASPIASGSSASVSFSMTPTKPGSISNSPTLTSTTASTGTTVEVDPDTTNNTLTAAAITASTITVNNTPPGPQSIHPVDPITGIPNPNVLINFPNVTTSGSSFVTVTPTGPALGTSLLPVTQYFNVWSAAVSTPPITVCVNYTATFPNPERVRLIYSNSSLADITSSLDQQAKIVCGKIPGNQQLPSTQATAAALVVTEPPNTAPLNRVGTSPTAAPSTQSSGKGVTGTAVTLSSNILDNDTSQGCFTPIGSTAAGSTPGLCSDTLVFTWTGQFTDGPTETFTCSAPYTGNACSPNAQTFDVSVTTTSQILSLTVTDQAGGVLGPIQVPLSGTPTGGGQGTKTITVNKGQTATYSNVLTVTYAGTTPLILSFTGAPSLSTNQISCSASPATLAGPVTNQAITVLCSTQGQVFAMSAPPSHSTGRGDAPILASVAGLSSLPLVGLLLLPGRTRRKKYLKVWAIFGLLVLMVVFQVSCGGGGKGSSSFGGAPVLQNAGTPSGTYTVNVTPAPGLTVTGGALTLIVQ
jgi:uncharacterized repeat protein (TIGR01451 family)